MSLLFLAAVVDIAFAPAMATDGVVSQNGAQARVV